MVEWTYFWTDLRTDFRKDFRNIFGQIFGTDFLKMFGKFGQRTFWPVFKVALIQ